MFQETGEGVQVFQMYADAALRQPTPQQMFSVSFRVDQVFQGSPPALASATECPTPEFRLTAGCPLPFSPVIPRPQRQDI